jgi:RND family efflux transporter MFP subunit
MSSCGGKDTAPGAPETLPVKVAHPLQRDIVDSSEYTARVAAPEAVQVRARVNGYLDKVAFKEGDEIKEGDLLFQIDPRPYQAAVDQSEAQVRLQEANLKYQEAVYQRNAKLLSSGAVTLEETQQALSQRDTAKASLAAARATLEQAKLNLGFTRVEAPITGRMSRTLVTKGNLVVADQTLLTTIVSEDPVYVYFDADEYTVLTVRELIRLGKVQSAREKGVHYPVYLSLPNEDDFPHEGYIDFLNNQIDPNTGTLQIRGIFANPQLPHGVRLFIPGMFVRVRVPVSDHYSALLVSTNAIGTDQNIRYVYVLNDRDEVERRDVQLGQEHGGLQVIADGLKADDRVIISNVQRVHPGVKVEPTMTTMPEPTEKPALPTSPRK